MTWNHTQISFTSGIAHENVNLLFSLYSLGSYVTRGIYEDEQIAKDTFGSKNYHMQKLEELIFTHICFIAAQDKTNNFFTSNSDSFIP